MTARLTTSARQSPSMTPQRKGPGGAKERLRPQPHNLAQPAKARAFALKTRFTNQIFEERVLHRPFESAISPSCSNKSGNSTGRGRRALPDILRPLHRRRLDTITRLRDEARLRQEHRRTSRTHLASKMAASGSSKTWGLEVKTAIFAEIGWNAFRISFFPCV